MGLTTNLFSQHTKKQKKVNTEKTIFNLPDGTKEITILQGEAVKPLPLKEPKSLSYSGDIKAVSAYVAIRKTSAAGIQALDVSKTTVTVDKNARTIVLNTDPESHYNTTVTATLSPSEELKQFQINTDKVFDRKALHKLLKFGRGWFADRSDYDAVISGLVKIRAKTTAELETSNNSKGSRSFIDNAETVIADGFIDKFTLSVPLFKGFAPQNIDVEICFEVKDGALSFWLESVGLKQTMDESVDGIFDAELKNVSEFVIINK